MPYINVTLAELQTALAQKYEQQPFWSADQARRAINEGLKIWNAITGMWSASVTVQTIPDDPHLFVSGALVQATQVKMGSRVLTPTSVIGLDLAVANWEGVNTETGGLHPTEVAFWAPMGLTEIMLYPKDAPPGQQAVVVSGVMSTPILVNAGDFLDLGNEEINTLLGYALHVLSFGKGIEALENTRPLLRAFYAAAAKRNAVFAGSNAYRKIMGYDRTRGYKPMEDPEKAATATMAAGEPT